jgi:hypothetical protein
MENIQKIDAFFNNELSDSQKEQFLADLKTDQTLQSEFAQQEEIVEGIKDFRKAELISRLNDIKIVSSTQYLAVKVISSIGVIAMIGFGAYLIYFNNSSDTELIAENNMTEIVPEERLDNVMQAEPQDVTTVVVPEEEQVLNEQDLNKETKTATEKVLVEKENTVTPAPDVDMPEVVDGFDTETLDDSSQEDLSIPANTASSSVNLRSEFEVEVKMKRRYNFHYQIVDKKLILFGDFKNDPFEILELNRQNGGVNLYLYYQDHFYGINQDSDEIQSLEEITDPKLVQKLEQLR